MDSAELKNKYAELPDQTLIDLYKKKETLSPTEILIVSEELTKRGFTTEITETEEDLSVNKPSLFYRIILISLAILLLLSLVFRGLGSFLPKH